MNTLPALTPEQSKAGLEAARAARKERALALAELKAGTLTLADILTSPNETLRRTKVTAVLLALPGVGKVRAAQVMEQARIDPKRRVGGLGANQRAALEAEFAPVAA